MPKNRVLLNNDLDRVLKASGLIFLYVNIDTLKSILAYFQIIGSRILGYTSGQNGHFWDFHDIFFVRNSSFYAKPTKNSENSTNFTL